MLSSGFTSADISTSDPVVLTFATVGDSRQDPLRPDPSTLPLSGQDAKWAQNSKALARILRTIHSQKAKILFFNGDMINGYGKASVPAAWSSTAPTVAELANSDLVKFYMQYGFWRGMVADLMEAGTYVVPVPGNHEVQCNSKASANCGLSGKHAMEENENAWRDNMGDLIMDTSRWQNLLGKPLEAWDVDHKPAIGVDGISTDQSQLSYSFDFGSSHFVVINTDPVGNDAHAPVTWLAEDLAAAKARGSRHFFVFGHKMAFPYVFSATAKQDGLESTNANAFWDVIEQYGATYFCGHEHIFNISRPRSPHGTYQVLVGSGGSPFDAAPGEVTVHSVTDRT
ncbi:MAG: metallophosphoesterase, partial [Methylococcus sp.]|nr:metallophosphoesterase [Methylococcus sp.]